MPSNTHLPPFAVALLLGCVSPPPSQLEGPASAEEQSAHRTESSQAAAREPELPADAVEEAIRKSLPVLQTDGEAWLEGRISIQDGKGCVSCHQVPFGLWGLEEARRAGIELDASRRTDLASRAAEFISTPGTARAMSWGPLVLGAGAAVHQHAGFLPFARRVQRPDGRWDAKGQFPEQRRPLAETNAVATMWTMLALESLSDPEASGAELDEALARARESVAGFEAGGTEDGRSTEWLLLRSLTEDEFDDDQPSARLDRLVAQQNRDGGWSWLPEEASNAMSTGQVLYRLSLVPPPRTPDHARAVARGTAYLLATQTDAGLWPVASALTSNGAKASKDYVYAYWGTAWATIGLARTLDDGDVDAVDSP